MANSYRFPENGVIADALCRNERVKKRIISVAARMQQVYHLSVHAREDLETRVILHIYMADWHRVLYKGGLRPRKNDSINRIISHLLEYTLSLVLNSMRKQLHDETSNGLKGLSDKKPSEKPMWVDDERDDLGADGMGDRYAALQISAMAQGCLSALEWQAIQLSHGFDGGASRSCREVAAELEMSRADTQELLDGALLKVRATIGIF